MKVSKKARPKEKIKTPAGAKVIKVFLIIYAALILYPYLLALNSAFRDWGAFSDNIFGFSRWTLDNFKKVLTEFNYPVVMPDGTPGAYYFPELVVNTALFALGGAAAATLCPMIVGYCTAKFPYKFSKMIIALVYVLMALPIFGTTPATIEMMQKLGIYNTIPGTWYLKFSFCCLYTLIFNATFRSIPNDYIEAAYIDGAGNFSIFTRVMVPLCTNTAMVVFILQFVALWSDYTTALYFTPSYPTLSLTLLNFSEMASTTETMQMAACVLLCIPSLILFATCTEKFTESLQIGGIKG